MKKISVVSSCFNEEGNLDAFYTRVLAVLAEYPQYDYEIIVADNCSTDGSREVLRRIAAGNPKFKVIMNSNNFGHIRSPYHALFRATGDVVISLCSDLQEPPEVIKEFIQKWEEGFEVVVGIRTGTQENCFMATLRKIYYAILAWSADHKKPLSQFTGFGLYGRRFCDALKQYHEPYPYFRGLVTDIGFKRAEVKFVQDRRHSGQTKNNFFSLYDMAMTGFVNHSKFPLRAAVFCGFFISFVSMGIAFLYLIAKLIWWNTFSVGIAPLVIGLFFLGSVQLIFIGVIGEYVGAIWTQVKNRPLVIEEETINFEDKAD